MPWHSNKSQKGKWYKFNNYGTVTTITARHHGIIRAMLIKHTRQARHIVMAVTATTAVTITTAFIDVCRAGRLSLRNVNVLRTCYEWTFLGTIRRLSSCLQSCAVIWQSEKSLVKFGLRNLMRVPGKSCSIFKVFNREKIYGSFKLWVEQNSALALWPKVQETYIELLAELQGYLARLKICLPELFAITGTGIGTSVRVTIAFPW